MLLSRPALELGLKLLTPEAFYRAAHQMIFDLRAASGCSESIG